MLGHPSGRPDETPRPVAGAAEIVLPMIAGVFLLSGATSLIYQAAWMRMLSLFLGSDVYAATTTLCVFMGGLSLGSWLSGRVADRLDRPLVAYALCELGVALAAWLFPQILSTMHGPYQWVYRAYFSDAPWVYHAFRLVVAAVALLLPTLLLGATLPLVIRQFATRHEVLGRHVGTFYALNTLGALIGTLAGGFLLIPWLGVSTTVRISIVINVAIGLCALALAARIAVRGDSNRVVDATAAALGPGRRRILLSISISGAAALALEVVWMRILVQSFSATVYAFSIMLASFLFGTYQGSRYISTRLDSHPRPAQLLFPLETWIAAGVSALSILAYFVPGLFGLILWSLTNVTHGAFGASSAFAQLFVAMLLIAAPTILLGAALPIAVKAYAPDIRMRAAATGTVYAANTAGAVIGSLLGGFVLLPLLGARMSLLAIAALFALAGVVVAVPEESVARDGRASSARLVRAFATSPSATLAAFLLLICSVGGALLPAQTVANFNLQGSATPEVLYHGEGVAHTVDIVKNARGNLIMLIDGNTEADTSPIQMQHFLLKAHLPLLLHPDPRRIAVVGLGLGVTLAAAEKHPSVEHLRLVELSSELVDAHRRNPAMSHRALESPKLDLRIDDARNFMAMSDEQFDIITADPIHPRITGVGYLYTREYYEQLKHRLRPGGIVTQWMPMYQLSPQSFDVAFRTFVSVFPNSTFWYVRGHGLFVATVEETILDQASLERRFAEPAALADMKSIGIDTPEAFVAHLLMDAKHIASYLARNHDTTLNTDDNAWLEYHTPFELLGRPDPILAGLLPHAGWNIDQLLGGASSDVKERVATAWRKRMQRILPELAEPIE